MRASNRLSTLLIAILAALASARGAFAQPPSAELESSSAPDDSSADAAEPSPEAAPIETHEPPEAAPIETRESGDPEAFSYAEMSLEELLSVQVVSSASLRAQSMHHAPSSVSLLTFEDIEAMRGLNVAQPFRRLLGVQVQRMSMNTFPVFVRNQISNNSNEVLVLV
ncbi:MAG: hypothetical protein H5U40_15930, partial [Polyangiaceae bacterium]|nr:hypothetical protein [Polyangiaceae bacterium]